MFGEEPSKMQPDEFFQMFDMFLTMYGEAYLENERFRKQKEEEEKRAKIEAQVVYGIILQITHLL